MPARKSPRQRHTPAERHFMVLDNVQRLPEKLTTLYLGLTR